MSKITINIKDNCCYIYFKGDDKPLEYKVATFKDGIITTNECTNKTVIKLVVELIYRLGNALKAVYKSV